MATWDVFHSDRLEVERGLNDAALRAGLAQGAVTEDDLVRPAGSGSPWERLGDRADLLALAEPEPESPTIADPESTPPSRPLQTNPLVATEWDTEAIRRADEARDGDGGDFEKVDPESSAPALFAFVEGEDEGLEFLDDDDGGGEVEGLEFLDDAAAVPPAAEPGTGAGPILPPYEKTAAIPVPGSYPLPWDEEELEVEFDGEDEYDPLEEDEAVAEFTLARGAADRVEELDLAAMVDVAFQLVLFFLVTAATVFYKALEVPKPNPDNPPEAAQQARAKTLDQLMEDNILIEIDPAGTLKIDRQPVPGTVTMPALAERLRKLRLDTSRQGILLSADFTTPHRLATLAYDAANEVGMSIKIATPTRKPGPPTPPPPRPGL